MKKFNKTLALKRDTIRILGAELTAVQGGWTTRPGSGTCPTEVSCDPPPVISNPQ